MAEGRGRGEFGISTAAHWWHGVNHRKCHACSLDAAGALQVTQKMVAAQARAITVADPGIK
jgi:hypothetical protein